MTDKLRIKIAAGVTALFLAAVSAAGVITHSNRLAPPAAPATQAAISAPAPAAAQPTLPTISPEHEHD